MLSKLNKYDLAVCREKKMNALCTHAICTEFQGECLNTFLKVGN